LTLTCCDWIKTSYLSVGVYRFQMGCTRTPPPL